MQQAAPTRSGVSQYSPASAEKTTPTLSFSPEVERLLALVAEKERYAVTNVHLGRQKEIREDLIMAGFSPTQIGNMVRTISDSVKGPGKVRSTIAERLAEIEAERIRTEEEERKAKASLN